MNVIEITSRKNQHPFVSGFCFNGEGMPVLNPQDNNLIGYVKRHSAAEATAAIDRAVSAFELARRMPVHERIRLLNDVALRLDMQQDAFAQLIALEGVKTIKEARKEASRCVDTLRISAEEARRLNGEMIAFDQRPGSERRQGFYKRVPIGVIVAITPYNDPLNLVAHKIGPAIAAGNSIILKPHEATPYSALALANLFEIAGLPKGVLQVLTGYGREMGDALITDSRVRMVSFTGGYDAGLAIQQKAGMKKMALELGSNSPVIVMPDADLPGAIADIISGAFWAAGQNCLHVQRILLHDAIYDEMRDALVAQARQYRVGDKLDPLTQMGPCISAAHADRVDTLVKDAREQGARLLCGGERYGNFYLPTLLEDIPHTARLHNEEVFGPVSLLYRFHTMEEAIHLANDSDFGLQAGIFTRDINTAWKLADGLDCGGVIINDSGDYRIDAMPFGGTKRSGLGREGIAFALNEMTEPKMFCFNLS